MMDNIRQLRVLGKRLLVRRLPIESRASLRPRRPRWTARCEQLEPRELLSTTQDFTPNTGTSFALQQFGGQPLATVMTGGPTGNFLRLATAPTPQTATAGNNNSISFVTSDPGTFGEVTADWDFRVTSISSGTGVGMSFVLLNTTNFGTGTSGQAFSAMPQNGSYDGSLGFGFNTQTDTVNLSLSGSIVASTGLASLGLNLTSGVFIQAAADINFQTATVSLTLTPTGGSAVTVFSSTSVPGLSPYESRVGFQAENSATSTSYASFDLTDINVQFLSPLSPGTIAFSSSSYVANENQGFAPIEVVRQLPTGTSPSGSETVLVVPANGTAKNNVNYFAEIVQQVSPGNFVVNPFVTFGTTDTSVTVYVPVLDDHLYDGNKTVNLYISNYIFSNPTFSAPLGSPIVATLTINNTDAPPPTVSSHVSLVYAPHSRRVEGFRLQFSQAMDPTTSQNPANYEVLLPPAHKHGQAQQVPLSQAALDPSGLFVTLTRANLRQHLTKLVKIIVRGQPSTGLLSTSGTFLAGTGGVSGTDASLFVSI
ncbi:MAG: Calx-beta domain-containing protein [Isosphaeraceae bacterium]